VIAVAFIRNVMIGRKGLFRDPLLDAFARCGAVRARSLMSTGNVVFEYDGADAFAGRLAGALRERFALEEPVRVRSLRQLRLLCRRAPFRAGDVHARCVSFGPARARLPAMPVRSAYGDAELLGRCGADVYSNIWEMGGRSGGPNAWLEKVTSARWTTRSWTTVQRALRAAEAMRSAAQSARD
jgi:uncharacterized protein (DUF1697 family)